MKIEFECEICCEMCGEVIHNHFDCPACKKKSAGTTQYGDFMDEDAPVSFECEECGAKFTAAVKTGFHDEWEWEQVTPLSSTAAAASPE